MKSAFTAINAHYVQTSLALRQIRSYAPASRYFEFNINQPLRRMADELIAYEPDVVGFSCYIWNIDIALRLARALKAARPEVIIAVGGPETAYAAAHYIGRHPEIDYVLTGEGETTWSRFIDALEANGSALNLSGVAGRDAAGLLRIGPLAPPLPPEEWRYPYRPDEIRRLGKRLTYIETSRGCPFSCAYCLSGGHRLRQTTAEKAIDFLTRMADEGAEIIKLVDRTFNADADRAIAIWEALKRRADAWPQKPVFHFEITARLLDERALQCLESAPAGLFQLEIGVQTTDPNALDAVGRIDDYIKITRVVKRLMRRSNIHIHVDLIAGLPGETLDSFSKSFDDVWNMGAHRLQLGFLKLLRGSALRSHAAELGLRFDPDPPYEIEATPDIPAHKLILTRRIAELLDAYANSGKYSCTLRLITSGRSPWHVFDRLRLFYAERGLFERGLAPADRTGALYEFALGLEGVNPEWLGACLRHDCIARGGRLELPAALQSPMSPADRAALRAYTAPVRGQWIEHYGIDMAAYALGNGAAPVSLRACAILYDPSRSKWFPLDDRLHIRERG